MSEVNAPKPEEIEYTGVLEREDLVFQINTDKHGERSMMIQFSPDVFSVLNESEMDKLKKLLTTSLQIPSGTRWGK